MQAALWSHVWVGMEGPPPGWLTPPLRDGWLRRSASTLTKRTCSADGLQGAVSTMARFLQVSRRPFWGHHSSNHRETDKCGETATKKETETAGGKERKGEINNSLNRRHNILCTCLRDDSTDGKLRNDGSSDICTAVSRGKTDQSLLFFSFLRSRKWRWKKPKNYQNSSQRKISFLLKKGRMRRTVPLTNVRYLSADPKQSRGPTRNTSA